MSKPNSVKTLILDVLLIVLTIALLIVMAIMVHELVESRGWQVKRQETRVEGQSVAGSRLSTLDARPPRHETRCVWIND